MTLLPSARNILKVYRAANDVQVAEGLDWYRAAHGAALSLDPDNVRRAAGVIAAMSPKTLWARNLELAARAYADGHASGTLPANVAKANRILSGENPCDVLTVTRGRGQKVRNFYQLIADPSDPTAVCVDRHATDVAIGRKLTIAQRERDYTLDRRNLYALFADAYRAAAKRVQVTPAQVQAVTWLVWRETY